jgi:hypothetical protein
MRPWRKLLPILRNRATAIVTLLMFLAGNIGWPVTTATVAGGKCCKVSGLATCCCGEQPGAKNCGCNKSALVVLEEPAKKLPSCCQQKLAAQKQTPVVVNCSCGESSDPGFVVSTQPKITAIVVQALALTITGNSVPSPALRLPEANLTPDTPPPRPSVS